MGNIGQRADFQGASKSILARDIRRGLVVKTVKRIQNNYLSLLHAKYGLGTSNTQEMEEEQVPHSAHENLEWAKDDFNNINDH